jgi:hypothetical protein
MPKNSKISKKLKKNKIGKKNKIINRKIKGGSSELKVKTKKTKPIKKGKNNRLNSFNNSILNVVKGMTLSSIFPNNPTLSNSIKQEKIDEEQREIQTQEFKEKIKKENEEIEIRGEPTLMDGLQGDIDDLIEDGKKDRESGGRGLLSSLGNRLGETFGKGIKKLTSPNLTDKLEEVSQGTKVKELATKRQCDAQFITNLETLLNTCSEKEAVLVFNQCLRILKSKKQLYSRRLGDEIEKAQLLDFDDRKEESKQVKIPGIMLKKASTDTINQLETSIQKKLGLGKKKSKKVKKKMLQNLNS